MTESTTIRWEQDGDGVVILTLDDPNQSANTMNAAYKDSMEATVDRLEAEKDDDHRRDHHLGQEDLLRRRRSQRPEAATKPTTPQIAEYVRDDQGRAAALETLGKPVVAAINGAALGGGLEIALAAHHRVVVDDPKVQLGFPEVKLGLLPGAGGVVRTVRMLGIVKALMGLLLQGQRVRPAGEGDGIVDEIVAPRGADPGREGVDRGEPGGAAAVGRRQEVQDPRGDPDDSRAGAESARRSPRT